MLKNISIVILFLFGSVSAFAESHWHTSTIEKIYPLSDGDFVLIFDTNSDDCPSTSAGKYHYVTIGENAVNLEGANKMYSLAMTAALTDKKVTVYFSDTSNNCYINRMSVKF